MKLNDNNVFGSFDGFNSNIQIGKNIKNGMLIYTRFHEDAHRIFQSSIEIGWIIYFLKRDCLIAAKNQQYGYCNRIVAFVNILEKFIENITEIVANTCELLFAKGNGLNVETYIATYKREYKPYCFLFDYINCLEGDVYNKIEILFDASIRAMQEYDTDFVKIGLEGKMMELRKRLSLCEPPELLMQRILYGEIAPDKKTLDIQNILNVLEELDTLQYIQNLVTLIRTKKIDGYVYDAIQNKELMNLRFHSNDVYFAWEKIGGSYVSLDSFKRVKTEFIAIDCTNDEECVAYKYFDKSKTIKCCIHLEDVDSILENVKYIMYEEGNDNTIVRELNMHGNLIAVKMYRKTDDYLEKIVSVNEQAKFVTISESKDYAVSFGCLISKIQNNEIYFSVFNGLFSRIFYNAVELFGGETFYNENMMECFEPIDLAHAFINTMLFCMVST